MFQAGADSFSWSKSIWSDLGKCCRLAQTLRWKITKAGLQVLFSNDLVFHLSIIKAWWQIPTNTCLWLTASIVPGKKCSRSQQVMKQETKKQSHLFTCREPEPGCFNPSLFHISPMWNSAFHWTSMLWETASDISNCPQGKVQTGISHPVHGVP